MRDLCVALETRLSVEISQEILLSVFFPSDLTTNRITRIERGAFRGVRTWLLRLENNMLEEIKDYAFNGSQIFNLDFQNNLDLHSLGEHAFSGISDLQSLNLSKTRIWHLPTDGLINIKELNVEDVPSLKQFPSVLKFSHIDVARLTYPHHCCAFQHPDKQDPDEYNDYEQQRQLRQQQLHELTAQCAGSSTTTVAPVSATSPPPNIPGLYHKTGQAHQYHSKRYRRDSSEGKFGDILPNPYHFQNGSPPHDPRAAPLVGLGNIISQPSYARGGSNRASGSFDGFGGFQTPIPHTTRVPQHYSGGKGERVGGGRGGGGFGQFDHPYLSRTSTVNPGHPESGWMNKPTNESHIVHTCANFTRRKDYASVVCTPVPNAFNPCEDVMGYEWLRVTVWFVLLATLCGNLVVIVVLVSGRSKMTVPKFLMCNLSFADLLMGLYLLLLASIDVHSLGEYFTHAVSWQNDGGCQVAGFLTVFSSELSVFVLMVITLERWYAISYAIHLTKRLRIRQAWCLMLTGWIYASTMALLPLVGVSGYGAVSMCLPMEAKDVWDKVYIVSLLLLNGLAFLVICCCYISMFLKVRSSDTMARSNDATIAKRMSILVLTNFVCWAPIAFFGLTASFGFPMIDISNSKILLVFFYPLNSCANPFLYVILTKQFRKDVFILLGRYGICTERANQYKGTHTNRSHTNSRHGNGILLQNAQHMSDMSVLSHLSTKSSRYSLNGNTPKLSPQNTPQTTPSSSPKSSPLRRLIGVAASAITSQASSSSNGSNNGGAWSAVPTSENGAKPGCKERKLSVVPETSQASDDGSGSHEERVLEGRDSLRDLFDGKPHGRVRSASEYVVMYKSETPQQTQKEREREMSREGRRRCARFGYDRQPSLDTSISSATETSYISDSSWTRLDSFGSGQGQDGEWPGVAKAVAVAAAMKASASYPDSGSDAPISPTLARMRLRFFPSRSRRPSDGESPTRPLPHTQLSRLIYSRNGSQDDNYSSGTDDDLLDDEAKVKQSLL
ncbi:follicle-stimulating hormone receptor-like [Littorina saxatilis]|uniref:follicle-stimulating hormone receptor-like n=1 Tax=Littorina saxatilis TaxID=31220 RepID=UPI0038B56B87